MSKLAVHENKIYSLGDNAVYTIPDKIGATLWLRADAGIEADVDNRVAEWQDQSGNDFHAIQSIQANKPLWVDDELNGKPALRFDGGQEMLCDFGEVYTQPNTLFVVFSYDGGTSTEVLLDGINLSYRNMMYFSSGDLAAFAGVALTYPKTPPFPMILSTVEFKGSTSVIYENQIQKALGNTSTSGTQGFTIGNHASLSRYMNGNVCEIIFYNSLLPDPQRQSVENYLITKYALL